MEKNIQAKIDNWLSGKYDDTVKEEIKIAAGKPG